MANAQRRIGPAARLTTAVATMLLVGVVGAAAATATETTTLSTGDGGSGKAASSGGGAFAPGQPSIRDVICQTECVGLRRPVVGGTVQVTGTDLAQVSMMSFPGRDERVLAEVVDTTNTTAIAKVPAGATDGKVKVRDDFGNVSKLSPVELDIRPEEELGSAGELEIAEAETSPAKAYYFGTRMPRLSYVIRSNQRLNDLRIDIVAANGEIARSFFRNDVGANTTQEIRWNGKASNGKPARNGRYSFKIRSQSGVRATRSTDVGGGALGFKLYGFIFPVRGAHTYGDGIGAPRAGHTHQGVDVFAACGTRMVAARGGRVQYNGYHSAAGNYVVIDGKGSSIDFVYMHMVSPSPAKVGKTVKTGQFVGLVGESGNASGCHVHYEMWGAPGWYEGGSFLDPMPPLKKWDRYS